jgi:hypothetical protein
VLSESILRSWLEGAKLSASMAVFSEGKPTEAAGEAGLAIGGGRTEYQAESAGGAGAVPPAVVPPAMATVPAGFGAEFPALEVAIKRFWQRGILPPDVYYSLSGAAKQQAFTISGGLTDATLGRVHEMLAEHLEGPVDRAAFVKEVREKVLALPISDAHVEHVFRNAVNESYSQGMETVLEQPIVADGFPYRAYHAIHDDRVEAEHLALEKLGLNGTNVYHKDDPTWGRFRPPWRWQCRCGWVAISIRQAARLGVAEAKEWLDTGVEPIHRFVEPPPFSPPVGWDRLLA